MKTHRTTPLRASAVRAAAGLVALCAGWASAAPCDSAFHRQFDFWLGTWEVRTPDGKLAGVNRIERGYDGCVLHERYTGESGYRGESLNVYDSGRGLWHQTWVDNRGLLLLLEGRFGDGGMLLEGRVTEPDGKVVGHRIRWTPDAEGRVRQHWEATDEAGRWRTLFDGRYTRR